jgi:hypothetical protein
MKLLFNIHVLIVLLMGLTSCNKDEETDPQDLIDPQITISSPATSVSISSGDEVSFDILFADDNALKSISITSSELGINISEGIDGLSFTYSNSITISGSEGSYEVVITATDVALNSSSKTISITIKPEANFETVYAVGDVTWNDWDTSKAMPMAADENNVGWFEITLYSDGNDAGVKFIGQLDWAPNNWGLVSSADPSQGMADADNSEKILLELGYHTIRFNPNTLEYSVTAIAETLPTPNGAFHVMGCGFKQADGTDIDLCWDPSKAYPMTQESRNPYLHKATIVFSDATDLKFNGNQAWDELDWGFPEVFEDDPNTEDIEEQKLAPAGELLWTSTAKEYGADWKFFDRPGTYELILDEYLGQAQIRKVQ